MSAPDPAGQPELEPELEGYRVELDEFAGPLDLLLYLVRREEVEVEALPIARITEQYLALLDRLPEVDLERAGDYLVMAAQLLALKTRALLPEDTPAAAAELLPGPRAGPGALVQELLAYRQLKEQAALLRELEQVASRRYARQGERHVRERPREVDLWDLVSAFQRLEREIASRPPAHTVERDDTPLAVYVEALRARLHAAPEGIGFRMLFGEQPRRGELVATFLALLELIRLGEARAVQASPFEEIHILRAEHRAEPAEPEP
ncbi:MAG: segregation and condensation protein A [Planctomycetota bacterium]|nr:MAG: segregation and condensation protein A [Planctomycetota bacterium]